MATKSFDNARVVMPGYCVFELLTPKFPEASVRAGSRILAPQIVSSGQSDHSDVVYGRVIQCGLAAHRNSCEPTPTQYQFEFPLKEGTFITCRRASLHTVSPHEKGISTWDIISAETNPPWKPE